MKSFALTDIGLIRKTNEDRHLIKEIHDRYLLMAVADGMGGEAAGDRAAETVRKTLASGKFHRDDLKKQLLREIEKADKAIYEKALKDPNLEGMGTTVTGVLIGDERAHWFHVGDSRLYLLHNGRLTQLTKDQNWAQFLIDEGELTPDQAMKHPLRNLLDQCVGCGECEPSTGLLEIASGDLLMLSTDGLHNELSAKAITRILVSESGIKSKAESLIKAALDSGGKDNITVALAEI